MLMFVVTLMALAGPVALIMAFGLMSQVGDLRAEVRGLTKNAARAPKVRRSYAGGPWDEGEPAAAPGSGREPTSRPEPRLASTPSNTAADRETTATGQHERPRSSLNDRRNAMAEPSPDWLERMWASWPIWAGGVAIAAAGIFLVAYSIERGLLGPAARVMLALAFGSGLIAAAVRLKDKEGPAWGTGRAPRVCDALGAAGVATVYGAFYAAFALYALIPGGLAFPALAATSFLAFAGAYWFGGALAIIGLLGACAAPILVGGDDPQPVALASYLGVVMIAAGLTARFARWNWLLIAAGLVGGVWTTAAAGEVDGLAWKAFAILLCAAPWAASHAAVKASSPFGRAALTSGGALAFAALFVAEGPTENGVFAALIGGAIFLLNGFVRPDRRTVAFVASMLLVLLTGYVATAFGDALTTWTMLAAVALLTGVGGFAAGVLRPPSRTPMAIAAYAPLAALAAGYAGAGAVHGDLEWGLAAFALALFNVETVRSSLAHKRLKALGDFSIAFASAFVLGLASLLQDQGLAVALAASAAAAAFAQRRLPLAHATWIAALASVAAPIILFGAPLGDIERSAGQWWMTGLSATATACLLWSAAFGFRPTAKIAARRSAQSSAEHWAAGAASLVAAGGFALTIRQIVSAGGVAGPPLSLTETTIYTLAWLGGAVGSHLRAGPMPTFVQWRRNILLGLAALQTLYVPLFAANPVFFPQSDLGVWPVFNLLAYGYALPGFGFLLAAFVLRRAGEIDLARITGFFGGALVFLYGNFEIRRTIHGVVNFSDGAAIGEQAAYTGYWIIVAVVCVIAGRFGNLGSARRAGLALAGVAVFKAAFWDTSDLDGLWRALSFLVLGAGLLGLGAIDRMFAANSETPSQTSLKRS